MSWDATLTDDRGHTEGEWNYTHNTNAMLNLADNNAGIQVESWWRHLDGMTGPEGGAFLQAIVNEIWREPATYEKLDPPNGWGSCATVMLVLREMIRAVPEWPTTWTVHG